MEKSFLSDRKAIDRLKKEYNEHGSLLIAYDYDNTIFDYHDDGLDLQPVIDLLRRCSDLGFTMILYTITPWHKNNEEKVKRCNELGINVHGINESPLLDHQNRDFPKKPFYSILLDDRAGLSASYNILKTTLDELR